MSFFNLDDPLLEEIKDEILSLDLNSLTPIEAMMKLNTERNDAIKALLTDEQKKKFEENAAAAMQGRGRGGF